MLQRFWDCSRLETKGVTAYAAKSAKMPSVLHASMHPEGLFDSLPSAGTPHEHSQILRKKATQDLLMWGVTAYAAKSAKMPSVLHASMHPEGIFTYYLRMVTSYFKLLLLSYLLPPQ